jgi:hypothetical protein
MGVLPVGTGFQQFLIEHALLSRTLHVDSGSFRRDGDRLLQSADAHFCVDCCRKGSRELDARPLESAKARECERHTVCSGTKIDDPVLT